MSEKCFFCGNPVNPFDIGTWKMVQGWVGGPKKDGLTLRSDAEHYAHDHCIAKEKAGQPADQPDLFGQDDGITVDNGLEVQHLTIEEVLEENKGMP